MKNLTTFEDFDKETTNEAVNLDNNTVKFVEELSTLMKKHKLHLFSFDDIKIRTEHAEKIAANLNLNVVSPITLDEWLKENK